MENNKSRNSKKINANGNLSKENDKISKSLLHALESGKAYQDQLQKKREERLWKPIATPCSLKEVLSLLTKNELDSIRKNLELKGLSSLKKAELARELERPILANFKKVLMTLDQVRYDLIHKMINNPKFIVDSEISISKVESLMGYGIIFPGKDESNYFLTLPEELVTLFWEIDGEELQRIIRRNTEWIYLTRGMLYYYGVIDTLLLINKIEELTKEEVDTFEFINVLGSASKYYEEIRFSTSFLGIEDYRVFDAKKIVAEQKIRSNIEFYPFTKKQLLKAGKPGFIDKTPALNRLLDFLQESYDLNEQETDEVAKQINDMITMDVQPSMLIQHLQSQFEFPSFEFVQQLMEKIMEVYNNTRMWILKGYSPNEILQLEKKHLKPLANSFPDMKKSSSNVIDLKSRRKIGRNDSCPCGSGKKYKKCCGK